MQQDNQNHGRDQNIFNQPGTVIVNPQAETVRAPNQVKLLQAVRQEVKDRLAQSLHQVVEASLLNLPKGSQPSQVQSPWQMELLQERQPPQLLPPETTITQVFDQPEVEGKLLILGEPGSGKTTTMLELARERVKQAEVSVKRPIPVLLNLSSWKPPQDAKHDPFLPWLLAELKAKYGIRSDLSQNWLAANQLLPLLDGLDEVAPQHQEACANAINQWLTADVEQRPMGLVVCCRIREYEDIVQKRLFLNGAIALQALTDDQIRIYLTQFGLEQVWHSAQNSESLQDLLRKPLFLSIFGFVTSQQRFDVTEWHHRTTEEAQREYLLDQYWEATMTRTLVSVQEQRQKNIYSKTYGTKRPPNRKALRRVLVFAAQAMEQDSLTELLIERIQPRWLPTAKQRWSYGRIYGLILGLIYGLILGLILGLIGGLDDISPVETIKISMSNEARREILKSLRQGLIVGLIVALILGLIFGLIFGLILGLIFGLIGGLKADIETRITPNQGMKNSRQNMLVLVGIALVLALPLKALLEFALTGWLEPDLVDLTVAGALAVLIWTSFNERGAQPLIQHIALRIVMGWNGYAPLRYDRLLDYATERLLLQRIGGRYRFMHKLLQEHFAAMELK